MQGVAAGRNCSVSGLVDLHHRQVGTRGESADGIQLGSAKQVAFFPRAEVEDKLFRALGL